MNDCKCCEDYHKSSRREPITNIIISEGAKPKYNSLDEKLNTLIALYEEEKTRLLQLIDDCVKEEEYQLAYFHQRALYQVTGMLQTLNNLNDRLYDEKSSRRNAIEGLEKRLESEELEGMKDYYIQKLSRQREELNRLNQQASQISTFENTGILDEVLKNLLDRKLKEVRLVLRKTDNLLLEFRYRNGVLKASLPFLKKHVKTFTIGQSKINVFRNLGFDVADNDNKLVLRLTGNKQEILERLNIILCKIIFEIFYFKEFKNESYIEFKEKPGR